MHLMGCLDIPVQPPWPDPPLAPEGGGIQPVCPGPREKTSRREGRASQEGSHRTEVRTPDRPQSYYTRSRAMILTGASVSLPQTPGHSR